MTTQITTDNIQTSSIYSLQGPRITTIQITNSSYVVLDDTAVSTSGGYIKITGTGFTSGSQVLVNSVAATSTTFVSAVELRAQLPATAAGTYILYVTDTNGGLASKVNGITFSGTPTWVTGSTLTSGITAVAYSLQLSATSDSAITYALQAGSTLPTGLSLSSSGLLSGTVTVGSDTTYSFTITATDVELQDSPRTFSLTILAVVAPTSVEYLVVAGGGGGGAWASGGGAGGGGGSGGLLTSTLAVSASTNYTVTVGGGGTAGTNIARGGNGNPSVFSSVSTTGGGGGGTHASGVNSGLSGGSGGGGSEYNGVGAGGSGTVGQGNDGGGSYVGGIGPQGGGGGGGASAAGSNSYGTYNGGNGGAGSPSSITGSSVTYAGGGGGASTGVAGGTGGAGGGGDGQGTSVGVVGTTNTGGGGGGAKQTTGYAGGSGVVIIAYPNTYKALSSISGGLTYDQPSRSGYRVYRFTQGTGPISW